jgi:hypothetical protein
MLLLGPHGNADCYATVDIKNDGRSFEAVSKGGAETISVINKMQARAEVVKFYG